MRWMMRSKIHKAVVTEANLNYVGSITIDKDFLDMVGLRKGEKVQIVSNTSGSRLETYVIEGERGSKEICMNGAASHLIGKGEEIIIIGYELTNEEVTPSVILLDKDNNFVEYLEESVEMNRYL
ncbi:MAG: aspartate 1-decarboxylase [Reichenbachiella sp.]